MSGSRLHKKIYKYGVFADEKFSTTKMMQICDGYRGKMKEGETVQLLREGAKVWGQNSKIA